MSFVLQVQQRVARKDIGEVSCSTAYEYCSLYVASNNIKSDVEILVCTYAANSETFMERLLLEG